MDFIQPDLPFFGIMTSFIGGRRENQDTCGYSETERGLLVVVCDGMGGGPGGKTASRLAVEAIIGYVKTNSQSHAAVAAASTPDAAVDAGTEPTAPAAPLAEVPTPNTPVANAEILSEAVQAANTALRTYIHNNPSFDGMGTTVTAMLINKDGAAVAHVGDSRIYQLRHKKIVFRTGDHSEVGKMVRNGILTEEQARLSAISNIITRAVGIGDTVEVDTATLVVQPGDRFVLCTDGVWGAMPEPELVKMFCAKGPVNTVAQRLNDKVEEAGIEKGGRHDNFSMIMVMALKDADTAVAEAGSVESIKADTISDHRKIVLSLPKPGPRTIASTVVAVIVLLTIIFLWKPWEKDAKETEGQPTEQTDPKTDQSDYTTPIEPSTDQKEPVVEENMSEDIASTPTQTVTEPSKQENDKKVTNPKEKSTTYTKANNDKIKAQLVAEVNRSQAHIDSLLLKAKCYQETLETITSVRSKTRELREDTITGDSSARLAKKNDMRKAVEKLRKKYSGVFTKDERDKLFYEQKGKNVALYGALGDSKLVMRTIDKSLWEGACNSVLNICDSLDTYFGNKHEAILNELVQCSIDPETGKPMEEQ